MRIRSSFSTAALKILLAAVLLPIGVLQAAELNLPAQSLSEALHSLGNQTNINVLFDPEAVKDRQVPAIRGVSTVDEALPRLLDGSGLTYRYIDAHTVTLVPAAANGGAKKVEAAPAAMRLTQAGPERASAQEQAAAKDQQTEEASQQQGTPEILVKGSRTLNTDIKRSEDAPQPYVVFSGEEIARSQALNLEEFLRTRLPMNTTAGVLGQSSTGINNSNSSINLRGLGSNQTLILIDGRRLPAVSSGLNPLQPDLNGVPLSAVERVEVLPSTASGIYGGSATGGVVNVVLKRDYQGFDVKASYANTFDSDAGNIRLDGRASFSLEGGRTQITISGSRSAANILTIGDRDFSARGIQLQVRNNRAAIYNTALPPLGATVNIRSANGTPLVLDNGTALNSNVTSLPLGYAGYASDGGLGLLRNAGSYNLAPPSGVNGKDRGLIAAPEMRSATINVRREFGPRISAFVDFSTLGDRGTSAFAASVPNSVMNLPAGALNNPFRQAINVRFPTPGLSFENRSTTTTLRGTGGLIARLSHDWTAEVDYGWSRSRFESVGTSSIVDSGAQPSLNTYSAGSNGRPALNALQEGNTFPIDFTPYLLPTPNSFGGPYDTTLKDATVRASGPIARLPGGPLNLSMLVERRQEAAEGGFLSSLSSISRTYSYSYYPRRTQAADSFYLEARAPLISSSNALPLARELEFQASARRDSYKTRSVPGALFTATREVPDGPFDYSTSRVHSTDYMLGLRFAPIEDLTLRASIGTGFLPPSITQISPDEQEFDGSIGIIDPKRGFEDMYAGLPFVFIQRGSPDLKPEESRSHSFGVIFTPRFLKGLRLSADYTQISKVDEIQSPSLQFLLDNEDAFPDRIRRGPNLDTDQPGWAGPVNYFNAAFINIARSKVQAYDFQADYTMDSERSGGFHFYAIATWEPHYRNQLLPGQAFVDRVGFTGGPLEWRGNAGIDWNKGPLAVSWNAQFYDDYLVYSYTASTSAAALAVLNQGSSRIARQLYHDVIATYRFDAGFLADTELSFGIQNLFDTSPPILAVTDPAAAGYSTYGDPRMRRYSVSVRRSF